MSVIFCFVVPRTTVPLRHCPLSNTFFIYFFSHFPMYLLLLPWGIGKDDVHTATTALTCPMSTCDHTYITIVSDIVSSKELRSAHHQALLVKPDHVQNPRLRIPQSRRGRRKLAAIALVQRAQLITGYTWNFARSRNRHAHIPNAGIVLALFGARCRRGRGGG